MLSPRSSQAISLRLTPMQIPATVAADVSKRSGRWQQTDDTAVSRLSLVLRPGEASEMLVQIRNLSAHSLQLALQVEGDFPPTWCQIGTEGAEVRSGQQTEAVLYFQLAADFFEHHQALRPGETLKLNYQGRLLAKTQEAETGRRQVETADFHLWVRPHTLYPTFLPAIYGEIDFIGRFLKIFEQSFEPSVQTLDALWAHLDPLTTPTALLPFLAHWVGWQLVPYLSLERQRSLIRNAITIYRWRGTRRGLRLYLHLATGLPLDEHLPEAEKHICITEAFHQGFVAGAARLGEDAILGGGRPFYFKVHLRLDQLNQIDEELVRSIIEQEKPAFCNYDLWISAPSTNVLESA